MRGVQKHVQVIALQPFCMSWDRAALQEREEATGVRMEARTIS